MNAYTFITSDNHEVKVAEWIVEHFKTIKTMLEDLGSEELSTIPLPSLNKATFDRVIAFAIRHHDADLKTYYEDDANRTSLHEWDRTFIDVKESNPNWNPDPKVEPKPEEIVNQHVFDLMNAANYLDYPHLLEICMRALTLSLKDKSVEDIRAILSIKDDLTDEEKRKIEADFNLETGTAPKDPITA